MREVSPALRILMTGDAVGGVWSYALTLAEALGALPDHPVAEIVLAILGPPPSPAQRAQAAAIPSLRLVDAPFRLEWMEGAWPDVDASQAWLLDLAAEHGADIVHLNGYAHAAAAWRQPVLVVGHSCVLSWWEAVHGTAAPAEWDEYRRRVGRGLAGANAVVAPTRAMGDALERHYGVAGSAQVVANGCALGRFRPRQKEDIVLAAGRLWDAAKNLATLDSAAARLAWPVEVAGDCRHPERGLVAPRHARALGVLTPDALAERMTRAAIYALPARYEPFGLSILEAAVAGCALVLGDIASLRELWDGAAIFVPPEDDTALAAAIAGLAEAPGRRASLAARAQQRASLYSAARMARRYADLYAGLVSNRAAGAPLRTASVG